MDTIGQILRIDPHEVGEAARRTSDCNSVDGPDATNVPADAPQRPSDPEQKRPILPRHWAVDRTDEASGSAFGIIGIPTATKPERH